MKKVFWTTIFWFAVLAGFIGYMRWFNQPLAGDIANLIVKTMPIENIETNNVDIQNDNLLDETNTGINTDITALPSTSTTVTTTTENKSDINTQLSQIQSKLDQINEKIDIQNSSTPDAVSVSLKTTKKTNVWIYPLDGSEYKKYVMSASDDILRDTLNVLFEKTAFTLADTKLDNDGNLTITLQRVPGSSFGGSAAVEQVKTAIEKTTLQFSQIKKVTIMPEEVLQP